MKKPIKTDRHIPTRIHAPCFAAVAALACTTLFVLWLFSLQGTRGLAEWMPSYRNKLTAIFLAGWTPFLFLLPALVAAGKGYRRFSNIVGKIAFGFSAALIVTSVGAYLFLFTMMHSPGTTRRIAATPLEMQQRLVEKMHLAEKSNKLLADNRNTAAAEFSSTSREKPLLRLAFSSDPHFGSPRSNPEATRAILHTINASGYDAFFLLGDIAEQGMPGSGFDEAARMLCTELPQVPIATVMGNHDALLGGEYRYRSIFSPDLYYRIDMEKYHILVLNLLWGTESFDHKQKIWLTETLASIPKNETVIVLTHCFFWSSGDVAEESGRGWYDHPAMTGEVSPILEKSGVALVISGHNHFMEYLEHRDSEEKTETAYAIIGSMGGEPDLNRSYESPQSRWFRSGTFGFIDLSLFSDHMELTFRDKSGMPLHSITR